EASGGASDVQANFAVRGDAKIIQCAFELQTAAAGVTQSLADDFNLGVVCCLRAGLFDFLTIDEDVSCQKHRLSFLARRGQTAFDKQYIDARLSVARSLL